MNPSIFNKIHDAVSEGVDKTLGGEGSLPVGTPSSPAPAPAVPAAPVPSVPPAPAPAPPSPVSDKGVKLDGGEEEDDFEFEDEKPSGVSGVPGEEKGPSAPPAEGTVKTDPASVAPAGDDEESIDWGKIPPGEVEAAFLRTRRGKEMLNRFKEMRELSKPAAEGGIGFVPTVQQIKDWSENAASYEALEFDFASGESKGVEDWAGFWFAPSKNPSLTTGQRLAASTLPNILRQSNPAAYQEMAITFASQFVNELLEGARNAQTEDDRVYNARMARAIYEYAGLGETLDISEFTGEAKPAPPDPKVAELQSRLTQREREDQERSRNAQAQRIRTITSKMDTDRRSTLTSYLEQALGSVKDRLKETVFYSPTLNSFMEEVDKVVRTSPGFARYQLTRQAAIKAGTLEALQTANAQYFQLAKPVIKNLRTKYLRDASKLITTQNSTIHSAHQTNVSASGTPGGGAPSEAPVTPSGKPVRLPGESQQDYLERMTRLTMGVA